MDAEGQPTARKTERVVIPAKKMHDAEVHFSRSLFAISIQVSSSVSRQVFKTLGLTQKDSESDSRLILVPEKTVKTEKEAIRRVLAHCGTCKEISKDEADKILTTAASKGIRLPLHRPGTDENPVVVE